MPGGVEIDVSYQEPTTNANGGPISDLAGTRIYYDVGAGSVKAYDVEATALTGGGTVARAVKVPWGVKQGQIRLMANAIDIAANVSPMAEPPPVPVDTLAPGAPKVLVFNGDLLFYSFREPIVNADGSPLTDLAQIKIYYNDTKSAALKLLGTYPASNPRGGGAREVSFPINTFTKGSTIRIYPRFIDFSGNQSAFPNAVGIKIP